MSAETITFADAVGRTLAEEMERDASIVVFGEDVELAYVFGVTKGLAERFGRERVRDTPMSEAAIVGTALGAAITGTRAVPELQFADFVALAMDQLANHVAKYRYMTGGQVDVPLTIRMPIGSFGNYGPQHCQSPHAWFCNTPGLVVAMPTTPADASGLLRTALRSNDPVIFLEHKRLYATRGHVNENGEAIPFGVGSIRRPGKDVTVVATGWLASEAMAAGETLDAKGIDIEVIDPRTLVPLDRELILDSFRKTGRLVVADEGPRTCGFAAEIAAVVVEGAAEFLNAPIRRVTLPDVPIPVARDLEAHIVPNASRICEAVLDVVAG